MSYSMLGAAAVPSGPWAQIVSKDGFRYQLTDEDVLWAGRMAYGEGSGDADKVLWTMAQRLVLRRGRSFRRLIQAYSQPINPIWRRHGICCAEGATGCPSRPSRSFYGEDPCAPRRLERRDQLATMPWERLPEGVRRDVLAWARAEQPDPVPKAVDFAAPSLVRSKMSRDPSMQLVAQGANWFVSKPASRAWPDDYVSMVLDGRVAGAAEGFSRIARTIALPVAGAIFVATAGGFAYWAWRRSR